MKYIQIRHMNYWWHIHDIEPFRIDGANEIEFSITEDKEGDNLFFHLDFYNLSSLVDMIKKEEFMEKENPEYNNFIQRYHRLKNGESEYFIGAIYYKDHYPTLQECELNGRCIFDLKSPTLEPYYAVVFLNENKPLTPEKVMNWIEKLSKDFFKQSIDYEIAELITKEYAQLAYNKEFSKDK